MSLTPLEQRAYEIIKSRGKQGVFQNELWKMLGVDSREGSRIALKLLKKGLIQREPVIHGGRKTYKLFVIEQKPAPTIAISIESVIDIPCFSCTELSKCGSGGYFNPFDCPKLTRWILENIKKITRSGGNGSSESQAIYYEEH